MFSIDQNCHPLWDVVPKIQALAAQGWTVTHFIEDVDMAYTAIGAAAGDRPRLAPERFHRSGGADWGAAVFYHEFLGRQPVEIRDWEPLTGVKTNVLARQLGRTVDDLYDEFSPSDNWQLIGPSYVGDADHHRLVGDLTVGEAGPFLREMMDRARADMRRAFPAEDSQNRLDTWFAEESARLADMLDRHAEARLVDLYRDWLGAHLPPTARLDLTSSLLACGADAHRTALLELFTVDYHAAAALYNDAIAETGAKLRPLDTARGELPFFAVVDHDGHVVRTHVFLEGEAIRIGPATFALAPGRKLPIDDIQAAGVRCLPGKAILLAIQVRLGPGGSALALPHRGSLYMPTSVRLAEKLAAADKLPAALHPVVRVRFALLDRLAELDTPVALPDYLAHSFGRTEMPARRIAENWRPVVARAKRRLESLVTEAGREAFLRDLCPDVLDEIAALDARRRELAHRTPAPPEQIRPVSRRIAELRKELAARMVAQIHVDWQTAEMDYWDSRGALMPWCIALGGESFYRRVLAGAEISEQ